MNGLEMTPDTMFILSYCLSGLICLGDLLASARRLSVHAVFVSIILGSAVGVCVAMSLFQYGIWQHQPWRVISICVISSHVAWWVAHKVYLWAFIK